MEEIQHFSHEEHPLIFEEEFQNDGEKEVVCFGCDKSLCGPAYKCSHCNFFLHKSCAELPNEIQCHPLHPNHILFIQAPARNTCDACNKSCQRCFFYRCTSCDFDIEIECASIWLTNTDGVQHFSHKKHPLMFVEEFENDEEIQVIVCSGCDQSIYTPAYKCSLCNFFLHKSCAELSPEIQHPVHPNHTLVLQKPSEDKICDACSKNCERCFFYHCNSCDFDLDIECASIWESNIEDGHQHEFVPIFQQIHFTCELCGEDRNSTAKVCRICQLLVHTACTQKPLSIRIKADRRHLLTLIYSLGKVIKEQDDHVFCQLCYKKLSLKYAGYYCQQCDFVAHLSCASTNRIEANDIIDSSIEEEGSDFKEGEELEELKHFHHEHNLFLSGNQVEVHRNKLCEACMQIIIFAPFYSCQKCNYFLHSACARLPLKKRHPKHPHLLTLSTRGGYIDGLIYCCACGRFSHGFAYKCHECTYGIDIRCSLIPKTFRHEGHQHSLFHAINSTEKCNACDRSDYDSDSGIFVCTKCNFALGFECATLPLKAKYEYDPHPLSLTCIAQNNSEEYYCLICEEEGNSNRWFYCCVECNFAAHSRCVVGCNPYMQYGRDFTWYGHQHPLNFVRRTKNNRPCDSCGEIFDGHHVINCTQCNFFVHTWIECTNNLRIK